jgi:hypothetical protein
MGNDLMFVAVARLEFGPMAVHFRVTMVAAPGGQCRGSGACHLVPLATETAVPIVTLHHARRVQPTPTHVALRDLFGMKIAGMGQVPSNGGATGGVAAWVGAPQSGRPWRGDGAPRQPGGIFHVGRGWERFKRESQGHGGLLGGPVGGLRGGG